MPETRNNSRIACLSHWCTTTLPSTISAMRASPESSRLIASVTDACASTLSTGTGRPCVPRALRSWPAGRPWTATLNRRGVGPLTRFGRRAGPRRRVRSVPGGAERVARRDQAAALPGEAIDEPPGVAVGRFGPQVEPTLGHRRVEVDGLEDLRHAFETAAVPLGLFVDVGVVAQARRRRPPARGPAPSSRRACVPRRGSARDRRHRRRNRPVGRRGSTASKASAPRRRLRCRDAGSLRFGSSQVNST